MAGLKVTLFELITYTMVFVFLFFNVSKTKKMGKIYDDLNVTARDYTLYFRLTEKFNLEFHQWQPVYQQRLSSQGQPIASKG